MVPTGAGTGSVFVLDTLPHVPFYQDGWGRQSHSFTFTQNLGGVVLNDTGVVFVEQGSYPLGGHTYRYHVEVDEPFYLRSGSTTFVHVGSYVLDNGLTGRSARRATPTTWARGRASASTPTRRPHMRRQPRLAPRPRRQT